MTGILSAGTSAWLFRRHAEDPNECTTEQHSFGIASAFVIITRRQPYLVKPTGVCAPVSAKLQEITMTFTESIKVCFSKYADFNGRASRSEYWWFALFIVLISLLAGAISQSFRMVLMLATLLPSIAVAARRLHDTNRSGWLQLIGLIPVLGWIAIIYFLVQDPKEPNNFGAAAVDPSLPET